MPPLNDSSLWDPEHLRVQLDEVSASRPSNCKVRRPSLVRGKFIAGPIDVDWICQAARLGRTALLIGLAVWHLRGLRRSDTFIVSNLMLEGWGILPDAKWRALRKLEKAGLITLERRGKRNPEVTLKRSGEREISGRAA